MSDEKITRIAKRLCHEWAKPMSAIPSGGFDPKAIADAEDKLWVAFQPRWLMMADAAVEEVERA